MIRAKDLSFSYGTTPIFDQVNFHIQDHTKVGIVGTNGSGKSTLLKLISGLDSPDSGLLQVDGKVEGVPQEVKTDPILDSAPTIRYYLNPHGQYPDYRLRQLLAGLEMSTLDLGLTPKNLSGGQKTKLAIIRALLLQPDILLLDEPTNFLDTAGKKWVMSFLDRYPKTLIIISHDLSLLDHSINKILYLNPQTHHIDEYAGNYTRFLELKQEKEDLLKRQVASQQQHIRRMQQGVLKMSHFKSGKGVRQRLNLERRLEAAIASLPQLPPEAKKIKLVLPDPAWVGSLPLWVKSVSKSFGAKVVLKQVTLDINRGERIALQGPNGAGKSTLIKIIMGLLPPDSGEVIRDPKLNIGYYSQEFENFDMNLTLLETMRLRCQMGPDQARPILGRFLFPGDKVFQKVSLLSGGEKTRLSIALLLAQNYNLLILDEPTTYLDPLSQRVILDAIKVYQGALLVVSHTPEFITELLPSRQLLLPENKFITC
jgi:ATPase subunit of ABC transporter with duplicated ATPase domains